VTVWGRLARASGESPASTDAGEGWISLPDRCCSVYAVFGALGIALYLGHLAEKVFKDSLLFPFALSLIGVGVIAAGIAYHKRQGAITLWIATPSRLPYGS
jgi:hypothetical protein